MLLPLLITKPSAAPHCAALPAAAAALQQHGASEPSALLLGAPPPRSRALDADARLDPVRTSSKWRAFHSIRHGRVSCDGKEKGSCLHVRGQRWRRTDGPEGRRSGEAEAEKDAAMDGDGGERSGRASRGRRGRVKNG